jgi:hypothetical protein
MLRDLSKGIDALYHIFLKTRASSAWETQIMTIRKWITQKPELTLRAYEDKLRAGERELEKAV